MNWTFMFNFNNHQSHAANRVIKLSPTRQSERLIQLYIRILGYSENSSYLIPVRRTTTTQQIISCEERPFTAGVVSIILIARWSAPDRRAIS